MNPRFDLFKITPKFEEELDLLNRQVLLLLKQCKLYAPRWEFGGIITPEIRGIYECFIPVDFLLKQFRKLALQIFKDSSYMPLMLKPSASSRGFSLPSSYPDFLNSLPEHFQPCFPLTAEKFMLLMFHFADPYHYGTSAMRYPLQMQIFQQILATYPNQTELQLLDVGCGTGQGTYEIAQAIDTTPCSATIKGLTLEPLEVMMAQCKHTPHRHSKYPAYNSRDITCTFQVGDITAMSLENTRYDFVFCNGLFGGPALNSFSTMGHCLKLLLNSLKINGYLLMSNHFHQGYLNQISQFFRQFSIEQATIICKKPDLIVLRKAGEIHEK